MYVKSGVEGSMIFDDKVIQNIVGITVTSCYGVVEMASVRRVKDYLLDSVNKLTYERGVVIKTCKDGIIDLDVHIVVGYSIPVKSICNEIKNRVAYDLENILNIKARNIIIFVDAIDKIS
ncbi:MAG: Asp23/Gls24 family envelope stress response protein [Bacilli bacterium]